MFVQKSCKLTSLRLVVFIPLFTRFCTSFRWFPQISSNSLASLQSLCWDIPGVTDASSLDWKAAVFTVRYQNFVSKICHESVWPQKQEIKQKKTLEGKNQREGNSPLEIHLQIFDLGFYIPPSVADLSRKISESNLRLGDSFLGGSFQKKKTKKEYPPGN